MEVAAQLHYSNTVSTKQADNMRSLSVVCFLDRVCSLPVQARLLRFVLHSPLIHLYARTFLRMS